MKKSLLQKILVTALFAALAASGSILRIGESTLQTLFSTLSGIILGPVWGPISQLLYLGLGLLGLPVFVGGGGPMYVVDPRFGFLLGMVLSSFVTGILTEKTNLNIWLVSALGLLSAYVIGLPFYYFIFRYRLNNEELTFFLAFCNVSLFLPGDLAKLFVVAPVGKRLMPALRKDLYR